MADETVPVEGDAPTGDVKLPGDDAPAPAQGDDAPAPVEGDDVKLPGDDAPAEGDEPEDNGDDVKLPGEEPENKGDKTNAPEAYADFDTAEGIEMTEAQADEIDTLAKELDLTQEQAQKLADLTLKQSGDVEKGYSNILDAQREEWKQETASDKEIGGPKIAENMAHVKLALDKFATPGFKDILNKSGLSNNVDVLKFMFRAGKAISEDTFVGGNRPDATPKSPAQALYNKSNK